MTSVLTLDVEKRIRRKLENLPKRYMKAMTKLAKNTAKDIQKAAQDSIKDSPTLYRDYTVNGKDHWSSNPGKAPNELTGDLRRSIKIQFHTSAHSFVFTVTAQKDYAMYLELGTKDIEPRPFMQPAFRKHSPNFTRQAKKIIKAVNLQAARGRKK